MTVHIPFATHSGLYDLGNIDPQMFELEGIGASLAKINRYAGRTPQPWSVAAHSLLVYELADRKPWALFHDAHESVLGDATAPGMKYAEAVSPSSDVRVGFDLAKAHLDQGIASAFSLTIEDVHAEDIAACDAELSVYFGIPYPQDELTIRARRLLLEMIENDLTWQQWGAHWIRAAKPIIR